MKYIKKGSLPKPYTKDNLKKVSGNPGVYTYYNESVKPIYIGKAKNLKNRLRSYQSPSLIGKTKKLIENTKYFKVLEVSSELESLLLEARLVRKYMPHYNSQLKDDKNPLYIKISKEEYPRVLTIRKKDVVADKSIYFGPFPNSSAVKSTLKSLRRIFPFSHHKIGKKPCIYSQMGLCSPCPNMIASTKDREIKRILTEKYIKNINYVKGTLSGRISTVRKKMEKDIIQFSKKEAYEHAKVIRNKLEKFNYITQPITPVEHFLENPNMAEDLRYEEMKDLKKIISKHIQVKNIPHRIECYDVAHLSGNFPTASMVTFIDALPDKSYYRHFKINRKVTNDDVSSLKEVAKRRVKHFKKWGTPDLVVVDGGKGQVKVMEEVFSRNGIPVMGIAKGTDSLIFPSKVDDNIKFTQIQNRPSPGIKLVKKLRDEAHRFARRYHHLLLQKYLIPEK